MLSFMSNVLEGKELLNKYVQGSRVYLKMPSTVEDGVKLWESGWGGEGEAKYKRACGGGLSNCPCSSLDQAYFYF